MKSKFLITIKKEFTENTMVYNEVYKLNAYPIRGEIVIGQTEGTDRFSVISEASRLSGISADILNAYELN